MSDGVEGTDIAKIIGMISGGGGLLAAGWALVKWLGGRAPGEQNAENTKKLTASIDHLTEQIAKLREDGIRTASHLGSLESKLDSNKERINETSIYWREQHEKLVERVAEMERRPAGRRKA